MEDLDKLKQKYNAGEHKHDIDLKTSIYCAPENYGVMEDIVRALDYSLKKLDEKFGKYKGIVYRQGYMDTGSGQYFSTSSNPKTVAQRIDSYSTEYSVIRTKSGHKIVDFQKEMGSRFAHTESEILLDRKCKYRLVPIEEYDEELLKARERMANNLFKYKDNRECLAKYTREQFLEMIKVYDEI